MHITLLITHIIYKESIKLFYREVSQVPDTIMTLNPIDFFEFLFITRVHGRIQNLLLKRRTASNQEVCAKFNICVFSIILVILTE